MFDFTNIPVANPTIFDAFAKGNRLFALHNRVVCSVSGGSDSDIMLDMVYRLDADKNVDYVFFDTGWEYKATKTHLSDLEQKYDIEIKRVKVNKPVPYTVHHYGQPFLSKFVSEMIQRLQRHNFQWEDEPYEVLSERYPHCLNALKWWCNKNGDKSRFNIERNKLLKEFMIANPPTFKISNKCCYYAKKLPAKDYCTDNKIDMNCVGVRKAENGIRSQSYKSCFSNSYDSKNTWDDWRPLFWFSDSDKVDYEKAFNINHSICYTVYGLIRTGCAGCPFGSRWEEELKVIAEYEPELYKAAINLFGDSYEYHRKYKKFKEEFDANC